MVNMTFDTQCAVCSYAEAVWKIQSHPEPAIWTGGGVLCKEVAANSAKH